MKHTGYNKGYFMTVMLVLMAIIVLGMIAVVITAATHSGRVVPVAPSQAVSFQASQTVATTSQPSSQTSTTTLTFKNSIDSYFEGTTTLIYKLAYTSPDFSVASSGPYGFILHEAATGASATVDVSYEGGRGYTPQDYMSHDAKLICPECAKVPAVLSIRSSHGMLTIGSSAKDIVAFMAPNSTWLFTAVLENPTPSLEHVLSGLKVSSSKAQPLPTTQISTSTATSTF